VPWNVVAGEEFEMRLYLVNISRKTSVLFRIKELVPVQFKVIAFTDGFAMDGDFLDLQQEKIGPFELKTIKLRLKAAKPGVFTLNPHVIYVDESGKVQECRTNEVTITVKPPQPRFEVLPGRVTTGSEDLDAVLFGGIPKGYAIALISPSGDAKELVVQKFLDAEIEAGGVTFLIAAEAGHAATLSQEYPSNLFLLICNLQADSIIQDAPNVFKVKGVESLTEIDIALTKAFRTMPTTPNGERGICIDIISDVLLQHHALKTRKWLSGLLTNLKSKKFTTLAVLNPQMHTPEEIQAILSLFDGEVTIAEKDTPKGVRQTLRIKRLFNQRFSSEEIILNRGKLER
jgi:KaiC/GvpD/RAD55 family RecA-like ATPase